MTSKMQPNKVISDVNECILELKTCFSTTPSPIDDDNTVLHRFEEKLEHILLLGLKEKPGLLGSKKSYWDYICTCFASTKRVHEGIQFVKSISEIKTSLGRGRALIRFCLMQKCLADTLQTCFMNQKTTRDFYTDRSVPVQIKLWSLFITSLYDLNELNFDLTSRHAELDVAWPSFARKIFMSSENELPPNRSKNSASLYSFSSQNDYDVPVASDTISFQEDSTSQMSDKQLVNSEMDKLAELNVDLSQKNQCLKEEVLSLMKEKVELDLNVQELRKECQYLQQKSAAFVKDANEIDVQKCARENELEVFLRDQQLEIKKKSVSLKESVDTNQDSSVHSITDSKTNSKTSLELQIKLLQDENIKLLQRIADFEHNVPLECNSENLTEIKSNACENLTAEFTLESKSNLPCSVNIKPEVNCLEQNLSDQGFHTAEKKADVESMKSKTSSVSDSELSASSPDAGLPLKRFSNLNINEFLLETKRLISDIVETLQICDKSVGASYHSRLSNIRDFFEIGFTDKEKLKEGLIQNQLIEKYVTFIKQFAIKQDNIVSALHEKIDLSIKGNEELYSKICILKDLLRSYGFKLSDEHKSKTAPLSPNYSMLTVSSCINDDFIYDPLLKITIEPVLDVFKSSFSKLNDLNLKIIKLQCCLNSSQELNNNLICKIRDQEMHLKGVTKELEEAKHLVSLMKEQHRKLQSTEGILKYDLQEKRKLMSKLKQQLETTREDWNQVRLKNSKSEAEWQNLRKEFVQRHKQTSEESGFIDDKGVEEQSSHINVSNECNFAEGNSGEKALLSNCNIERKDIPDEPKKSRLELLEEQCQILYSSLLKGSKKRQEIDNRLEVICRAAVKSNEVVHNKHFSNNRTNNNSYEDINDTFIDTSVEDIGENVITDENVSNSPQSSSDVGSLHSECSSSILVNCSVEDSVVSSCPLQSPETNSPHSVPCELDCAMMNCQHENTHVSDLSCFPGSEVVTVYPAESGGSFRCSEKLLNKETISSTSPDSCIEPVATLSHMDCLLIKEKDLEESLKHRNTENRECSSFENKYPKNLGLPKEISVLEQEKRFLENKVQELEKKTLIISTELDQTTQQLILSKAAKEHEVAALQFQLNTEALKYERALKQFSEQNTGLENMKKKINDQEEFIHALEEALAEIREERESEQEHQWQELQELQSVLEAREQECVSLTQDVEKLVSFLEEERSKNDQLLSQFENFKVYSQRDKDALESELVNLQNDSKEMRKKLIRLLKEKDILWKRSDHLSYLHKAKINNRWVDDHEVSNCLGCKSNFSFILRKHHCRLCGRIFCYSCSNNWLLTASSSKRIRVCNECYVQYMEMKKETRRGSDVPQIEDESEDELVIDDLSFNPLSRSSFNSDIPLSIADSIISLPVKTLDSLKQSSPLFASAPDLRCSFKLDDGTCRPKSMVQENLLEADENLVNCDANENESANLELALTVSDDSLLQTDKHMQSNNIFRDSTVCAISTNEIEAAKCGVTGDLIVNAGEKNSLPILCHQYPMELQWSFSTNNGIIPIVLVHGGDSKNESDASVCYHNEHKTEDSMDLIYPGLYAFQFDNTSRKTAMKIQYSLKAKPSPDKPASISNLCSSL